MPTPVWKEITNVADCTFDVKVNVQTKKEGEGPYEPIITVTETNANENDPKIPKCAAAAIDIVEGEGGGRRRRSRRRKANSRKKGGKKRKRTNRRRK